MLERKSVCKRGHLRTLETVYKSGHCKQCTIRQVSLYQAKNPLRKEWQKDYQLKIKYNLSHADYELMFMQQQGKCAICMDSSTKLVVDHNHSTGKIRKLLCTSCNSMIGFAKESQDNLKIAAGYLKAF